MRAILLTSPSLTNDGGYVDAGVELEVGGDPHQIAAERADALVDGHGRAEAIDPLDHDRNGRKGGVARPKG